MKPYTEIPEDARCFIAYGGDIYTRGSNFFFVVFPKKYGRWAKLSRAMARFASDWTGKPYQKKQHSGGVETLISGIDGLEAWSDMFQNRAKGKNGRQWVRCNKDREEMEIIQFDRPEDEE